MQRFNKNDIDGFKDFLYNSYIHDGKLQNLHYEVDEDALKFEVYNSNFRIKTSFVFRNISVLLAVKGNEYGSCELVSSLTVDDEYSCLLNVVPKDIENSICVLLQMFSGDELYIIFEEAIVEVTG